MSTGFIIVSTCAISGVIYLVIGVLLAFKQKIEVINGVDFSKLTDIEGFCKLVGNSFLFSSAMILILGSAIYYQFLNLLLFLALLIFFLLCLYFISSKQRKNSPPVLRKLVVANKCIKSDLSLELCQTAYASCYPSRG
jgi:hypothetical protein